MKTKLFQLLVLILILTPIGSLLNLTFAQSQNLIQGVVYDDNKTKVLENASVVLLHAKDSILVNFTRTDDKGRFALLNDKPGEYEVWISYPKYADFTQQLKGGEQVDLEDITLTLAERIIEEVVVTGRMPIVIKGDTVEYDAGSFKVDKNSKVEDLLKVLPGISVDASGKITAKGKTVEKVLVDGEEFFGDDPKLVTRNVRSDMVDKVQLFEKRSEASERTGVDDGQRIQTINVQLKEEAKNGLFGKAEAGGATDSYYKGDLTLNRFKKDLKVGAFLSTGNTGGSDLSWQNDGGIGGDGSGGVVVMSEGPVSMVGGNSRKPKALNTGVNLNRIWNEGDDKLNLSYLYGHTSSDGVSEELNQNNMEGRSLLSKRDAFFDSENKRHRANLTYEWKIDSLTTLRTVANGGTSRSWNTSNDSSFMQELGGPMLNKQMRNQESTSTGKNVSVNTFLTRKLNKEGRSITMNLNYSQRENSTNQQLKNNLYYFNSDGEVTDTTFLDQYKDRNSNTGNFLFSAYYTEPITKDLNLSFAYSRNANTNVSQVLSFNKDGADRYTELDSTFSSDFKYKTYTDDYVIALAYNSKSWRINLRNVLKNDQLKQENRFTGDNMSRNFLTFNLNGRVSYNFSKSKNLGFSYSRDNTLPSLDQIQPLRNNEDELNEYLGNEDLKPSFRSHFGVDYYSFKALKGSFFYGFINYIRDKNPLTLNMETDVNGKSTYRWENLTGYVNEYISLAMGKQFPLISKYNIVFKADANIGYDDNYNFINGDLNQAKSFNYGITTGFARNLPSGLEFDFEITPSYSKQLSSLQPEYDNSGFILNSNSSFKYHLPLKLRLFTTVNYSYEAPTKTFNEKFQRLMINPGVSKRFLKNESLEASFIVNDLLNENTGFSRRQNGNMFVQRSTDTVRRYYMLKLSWDFNKMFIKNDE